MVHLMGSPWTGALAAIVVMLLVWALLRRYRVLERRGTPLPPGVGGARMVGTTGTVIDGHVPGSRRGHVRVLGEEWGIADEVEQPLQVGDAVVVRRVTGTRLVVAPVPPPDAADGGRGAANPGRT